MTLLQIYQFAEKQGISIDELNMGHSVAISLPQGWIAIDPKRLPTQVEKKECLAHELGHVETGAFYNVDSPCDIRGKHENKANKWAIQHLISESELDEAIANGYTEIWSLAIASSSLDSEIKRLIAHLSALFSCFCLTSQAALKL